MAMQDPNKPDPAHSLPAIRPSYHRRAQSEVHFRFPEGLDLVTDPFDNAPSGGSLEDLGGSEDDLLSTYMDIEKFSCKLEDCNPPSEPKPDNAGAAAQEAEGARGGVRPSRHRYSNSVDGSSMVESIEAKKAMAPEKLAELWTVDPKKAKRILANRQSAARSKERKARYMSDLERKVQTLQTEATTLSAQLTLFQRDTTGLTAENTELKIRLHSMEQQAQLCDALNEALKKEVERLKIATGEAISPTDTYNLGMHHMSYAKPTFYPQQQQQQHSHDTMQMLQFHHMFQQNMGLVGPTNSHASEIGRFQQLDISSSRGSSQLVKTEAPSISACESTTTL